MMTGKMPKSTPEQIELALAKIPTSKMSEGCKNAIKVMTQYEADRVSILQALRLPWVGEAQSAEALGSEVLTSLSSLVSQTKKVEAHAGDWLVREVGTDGVHVIQNDRMGGAYDLEAGIEIGRLSEEQKSQMLNWKIAADEDEELVWYPATKTREFVLIDESAMELLLEEFVNLRDSVEVSWARDSVNVEVASETNVPSNRKVFDFVTKLLEAGTLHISTYEKKGVFAKRMATDGNVTVAHTKTEEPPDKVFVYKSPPRKSAHDTLMLCPGDALVYRREEQKCHTMEKLAIQNNFTMASHRR